MSNLDRLHSVLGPSARERIFQALCTERDRLQALAAEGKVDADTVKQAEVLAELYAINKVADECCGTLRRTHAYCDQT